MLALLLIPFLFVAAPIATPVIGISAATVIAVPFAVAAVVAAPVVAPVAIIAAAVAQSTTDKPRTAYDDCLGGDTAARCAGLKE